MPQGWNLQHSYAQLPAMFFKHQAPIAAPAPKMVVFNDALAADLGLNADGLREGFADIFTGTTLPDGAMPIAQAYAGYQFGHFSMLGDGRAVLLGEQACAGGVYDIQLKGSGPTPFSRGGDGLAALAPMLREYIISEAMHALGIPTTRMLAVATTGGNVWRRGNMQGAVLTRVAASHIRVGTFNYASAYGSVHDVRRLADYSISRHFPHLVGQKDQYLLFFREVAARQAALIAKWMLTGFIHGVMNTDNMAISGETIDYGPCAFMDAYHPDTVFSSIDKQGRYAYSNQPKAGAWNLARLAEALLPLFDENKDKAIDTAKAEVAAFYDIYNQHHLDTMRIKLGLHGVADADVNEAFFTQSACKKPPNTDVQEARPSARLADDLLQQMQNNKLDFTVTMRDLSNDVDIPQLAAWQKNWRNIVSKHPKGADFAFKEMRRHNPAVIPRNHRVEEALTAAENGDLSVMHNLLDALKNPFTDNEKYAAPPATACDCEYKTFCGT